MSPAEPVTAPECYREDPLQGSGGFPEWLGQPSPGRQHQGVEGSWRRWGWWVLGEEIEKADREWEEVGPGAPGRGDKERGWNGCPGLSAQLQALRTAACPPRTHPRVCLHWHTSPCTGTCWLPPLRCPHPTGWLIPCVPLGVLSRGQGPWQLLGQEPHADLHRTLFLRSQLHWSGQSSQPWSDSGLSFCLSATLETSKAGA